MQIWSRVAAITGKMIDYRSILPIVSFTFDDAPVSSFTSGGRILEEHGFRGTYYVSAGLFDEMTAVGEMASQDTIMEFHGRGHEIGNHTYDHIDCKKSGLVGILRSVRRNRRRLKGVMSGSFAYPYGSRDARARVAVRLCTTSARGISVGINRDIIDLTDLKAAPVYARNGIDTCLDLISECTAHGGWLIFYTHDVCEEPSAYGCTSEQLTRLVGSVYDKKLTVQPTERALDMIIEKV